MSFKDFFVFTDREREFLIYGLGAYFLTAVLMIWWRQKRSLSHSGVLKTIFPKAIYLQASAKSDYVIFLINRSLFITLGLIGTTALNDRLGIPFADLLTQLTNKSFYYPKGIFVNILWSAATCLVYDFCRTLVHYAFHRIPALWEFHKLHHDAAILTPISVFRLSLVERYMNDFFAAVFSAVSYGVFIYLFGVENFNIITIFNINFMVFAFSFYGHFRHSHLWMDFGKWDGFFLSPAAHLVHHSVELRHRDKNFSTCFSIFDKMLGTYYRTDGEEHFKIGIRKSNGESLRITSLKYFYFGVFLDSFKVLQGKQPSYEQGLKKDVFHDGLSCWCGPHCAEVDYAFDRENKVEQHSAAA